MVSGLRDESINRWAGHLELPRQCRLVFASGNPAADNLHLLRRQRWLAAFVNASLLRSMDALPLPFEQE